MFEDHASTSAIGVVKHDGVATWWPVRNINLYRI